DGGRGGEGKPAGARDGVEVSVDGEADEEHEENDAEVDDGARAAAEVEMPGAGNEIRQRHGPDRAGLHSKRSFRMVWKCGASLSKVTSSSSGTRRVRAVTVMKFVSPPQRGTMCMWYGSAAPAPATWPKFMPTLKPSGR